MDVAGTYGEYEGGLYRPWELLWVSHISIYIWENRMATPW